MRFPVTHKMLMEWAGIRAYQDGKSMLENGAVQRVEYEHPFVRGVLQYGSRGLNSQFELLPDGTADNQCPCRDNVDRGVICPHVIALAPELIRRRTDPERERKALEEMRRAERMERVDESKYLRRVPAGTPGSRPAGLVLALARGWREACGAGSVPLTIHIEMDGRRWPADQVPAVPPVALSRQDETLLFVLEDIAGGPAPARLEVPRPDFVNLLSLHAGKPLPTGETAEPAVVNAAPMTSVLRMDMDRANGELVLMLHTELPFMNPNELPLYLVADRAGWVYDANQFWPLARLLPAPLRAVYEKPAVVRRPAVPRFIRSEMPLIEQHVRVETEITPDLFDLAPAAPRFLIELRGSPASLAATLHAQYDGHVLVAGRGGAEGDFAIPDPNDLLRYLVRNPQAEEAALKRLAAFGLRGEKGDALTPIVGCREVLNFLGGVLPRLRRLGWRVELSGAAAPFLEQAEFITPVVRVSGAAAAGWFEAEFDFEDARGRSLNEADIQRALLKGESFIERDGRTLLFDADAIESARAVFADCSGGAAERPGAFHVNNVYSAYVQSALGALDGIDVEAGAAWQARAAQHNRARVVEPVPLAAPLDRVLRPYQKDGVYWLRFLENSSFCGILADDMGLGKTVQALAWLRLDRAHPAAAGKPALVVCPTSLVENWCEEAARFVPTLRVLALSGAERRDRWGGIGDADLVVTSYALLRRDIDAYAGREFSAVILDEAQHIKNRSTQNAQAAKRLRAVNRLVLTGTPIENSVSDLWSIMDFLMPGYLGAHADFRQRYELPIARGGADGEEAQARLRRKLHPFLLRRLKSEVASDLPPRIERVASGSLTADQQMVYRSYVEASRRRIADLVAAQGFERSRMEILTALLRLRQICCHLELLNLPDLKSEYPSAKMDLFFELLDEALDGGHRVLVFSQFTSMLAILRRELEQRDRRYCYLDGATKERLSVVRAFNTNHEIPVFLISLKAGGTGLNLTGADTVIHFDPWWNPAVEDQATDRAHRIGQKRAVYSIKLITRDTVEEKVLALQKRKREIMDATLTRDEEVMQKLTWEDVRELLSL